MDEQGNIRLTDFGLAKSNVNDDRGAKTFCGTPEYVAPEMIKVSRSNKEGIKAEYGLGVDYWCLGNFIYELAVGSPPFQDRTAKLMNHHILNDAVKFPPNVKTSIDERDLVIQLLNKAPEQRLGARIGGGSKGWNEVKMHTWFHRIDWQKVYDKKYPPPIVPHFDPKNVTVNFDPQDESESFDHKQSVDGKYNAFVPKSEKKKSTKTVPAFKDEDADGLSQLFTNFVRFDNDGNDYPKIDGDEDDLSELREESEDEVPSIRNKERPSIIDILWGED